MSCVRIRVVDVPIKGVGIGRWIELDRPEKLNCLSLDMLNDLWSALRESSSAAWIGLTGAGRSFCTDLDLKEVLSPGGAPQPGARAHLQRLVSIFRWFLAVKIPTFVLARGYAAGGGSGLVACARVAVVSDDLLLRLPGGHLAELAVVAVPLLKLRAKGRCPIDSDWLGREFTALEAHRLGLVDTVVSTEDLTKLALRIAGGEIPPQLLSAPKRDENAVALADSELDRILRTLATASDSR